MAACPCRFFPQGAYRSRAKAWSQCLPLIQFCCIFVAREGRGGNSRRRHSHSVALEDFLAGRTQAGTLRLKALLNGVVIAEFLAAKALGVARACGLLLLGAHMLGLGGAATSGECGSEESCQTENECRRAHGRAPDRKDIQPGAVTLVPRVATDHSSLSRAPLSTFKSLPPFDLRRAAHRPARPAHRWPDASSPSEGQ
jgi:hypothetical protein